jgi:signal transduction histidine kinase/ActR/RegA family two-component response regulator
LRVSGETQISEALESAQVGQPLIVIFATYVRGVDETGRQGQPAAILVKALFLDQIQGFSDEVARGGGVRLWVADARGTVVATPDGRPTDLTHVSDLPIGAIERNDVVTEIEVGDETLLVTRYEIDDLGWQTFAAIPLAEARAGPINIQTGVLAVGIPLMLVVCIGIWLLVRYQRHEWLLALEIEHERDRADAASRQKSEFLSRMSHELRTPLNAVLGFAQVLEMGDLDPDQRDATGHILKGGRHLLELVNEVLDIARVESGTLAMSVERVEVDNLIRETVDLVGPLAAARSITVTSESSDAIVLADAQRLKQVLLNLLSNAIKYNHDEGLVTVTVEPGRTGTTRMVVADTGPGLDQDEIGQIFVPFDRLGAERTGVEGTGIGLALSSGLARAMGGVLEVASEPGSGSRFWVELPTADGAARDSVIPHTDRRPGKEVRQGPRTKILYVEDNLANLRLVERILDEREGTQLISVMQGGLAFEMALQHQPDLILLDSHLPDLDGDEVLARLKADPTTRGIPVVVVSADATEGRIEQFLDAGATTYATKPIDVQRFLRIVEDLLDT